MIKRRTVDGPLVTYGLIGLCCLAFLVSPVSGFDRAYGKGEALRAAQSAYFRHWGIVPDQLVTGAPHALITPLTALFVHGNWLHLLGNMLFLYVFGTMAEEHMGRAHFAVFYLVVGALAMSAYAVANAHSDEALVGASGAISGVLGAFLFLFPKARVTSLFPFLFFLPLRFPAWIVLLFWFALQWFAQRQAAGGAGGGAGPEVAYLAHLVGFASGFLYAGARYWRPGTVKGQAVATEGERQP
ncbi:rhomboid family intramembrane serine protease [Streptomyces sp. NBC_01497]|uniref:rhomboid family intramembrane serine protease n=1 Tax=Streptomyces sp. NBC_01497 TaxID=2903885 RepID=UPI002E318385|nr:rhomboid family intramembrane serine protease [Streptomyces sp. NBC_01497]